MEPNQELDRPGPLGSVRTLCKRAWWVFLIGGIASILFGLLAFFQPNIALTVLALYFAAWVLVDGVANIIGAVQQRDQDGWVFVLLIGLLGAGVGAYALLNPPVSLMAFLYMASFMAIVLGVLLISLGRKLREEMDREWILYLAGALSIIFGALILFEPVAGATSVVWLIATWAIIIGLLRIGFAFAIRNVADNVVGGVREKLR